MTKMYAVYRKRVGKERTDKLRGIFPSKSDAQGFIDDLTLALIHNNIYGREGYVIRPITINRF